ncbi:MAG TPA: SpvB/TcaC N-terminal domain-containing protein, partial [Methylomirabilota bacterium]|nr:SpvB/TcaC N-terminal domain-containing protein [Methylomirabilota bacterium]
MRGKSGVAAEILTALPRSDAGAIEPGLSPLSANLASGAFTYQVPIELPPGRVKDELALALTYELRAHGNGPFGVGWSVPVLAVERRVDRGVPRYGATDAFALADGTPLGQVAPAEYRPLVERAFRRIRFVGPHWEVVETDGTRLLFGETEESRLFDPAQPERVARWLLARREDTNGNVVRFRYERDLAVKRPEGYAAAQLYLRQVEYVNRGPADYLNVVRFDYE